LLIFGFSLLDDAALEHLPYGLRMIGLKDFDDRRPDCCDVILASPPSY
jgi:hypothetical protein